MLSATPNLHKKTGKNNEDILKQILVSGVESTTSRSLQANQRFKKFYGKKLNGQVLKDAKETTTSKNHYVDPNSNRKFPI